MKKCILIPMRGGSKGIYRKNLVTFEGVPLLYHVLSAAIRSKVDDVYVSSDDEEILSESLKFIPKKNLIFRPKEYADDLSRDYLVFKHFIELHPEYEYIVHLRATWPKITPSIINDACSRFESNPLATSLRSMESVNEYPQKMWMIKREGFNEYAYPIMPTVCSQSHKRWEFEMHSAPRQILQSTFYQNAAIDIVSTETIRKGSMVGEKVIPFIMDGMVADGVDIDDEKDLR